MARTPSMTTEEAEAILGRRGSLNVTSENRATVKKWLTAQGFPGLFVAGLSMAELAIAYNRTDGSGVAKIREKLLRAKEDGVEEEPAPTPSPALPMGNTPAAPAPGADPYKPLRDLLGLAVVDENKILDVMRKELPNLIPVVRLEVKDTSGSIKNLGEKRIHKEFKTVLACVSQNIPCMAVGPAGSGKSTIFEQIAEILELPFYVEGALDGAHRVTGWCDGAGRYQTTAFRQAYEHGGLYCWEEADNSDPSVPLVMNNGMANGHMSFPDSPVPLKRNPNFRITACANTYCLGADRVYVGRNQLDGATIDRFAMVQINYDETLERQLGGNDDWTVRVQSLRHAAEAEKARVIISPRASINGAKLLAAGLDRSKVEEITIWKGCDSELRRRIENRARA
jgi:cobaltochelatase CobS